MAWIDRAKQVATVGTNRNKHGCVIVRGGSVLSVGVNRSRTHDRWIVDNSRGRNLYSFHAEISALRACETVSGSTLFVVRINGEGILRASYPCETCRCAIESSGIKKVVYS